MGRTRPDIKRNLRLKNVVGVLKTRNTCTKHTHTAYMHYAHSILHTHTPTHANTHTHTCTTRTIMQSTQITKQACTDTEHAKHNTQPKGDRLNMQHTQHTQTHRHTNMRKAQHKHALIHTTHRKCRTLRTPVKEHALQENTRATHTHTHTHTRRTTHKQPFKNRPVINAAKPQTI